MNRKNELLQQFKNELSLRNYAMNSIDTYSGYLSQFFEAMKGKPKPLQIEEIKQFLLSITNMNTRAMFVNSIRNFYSYILKTPLSLDDIPYPRKTSYLPQILSIQEVDRMMKCVVNIKHKAILQTMYSCALRISEVPEIECNTNICHLDSSRKTLLVKGAKGFKDRYVPIPIPTIILLRNYRIADNKGKWLFMGQNQQKYSVRSIQQIFHRAKEAAHIAKKVTPHSLRHSRLTHLCEAGMDIYKLKEFAGHNNIKTTEIYLHLSKSSLVNNTELADLIIAQSLHNSELLIELGN
jgi:site-specific recombinase XerD